MAHPRDRLRPGEKVILDTRPHWWYFARPTAFLIGSLFMGVLVLVLNTRSSDSDSDSASTEVENQTLGEANFDLNFSPGFDFAGENSISSILQIATGVTILLSVIVLVVTIISWYFTHFFITTDRVVHRSGVLNRNGVEIPIERINTVFFEQNFVERLVKAGDVLVESAGESGVQRLFDIANPLGVQERLQQQIENIAARRSEQGNPGTPIADPKGSATQQIKELNDLRRQGIITLIEFEDKKKELLGRI